MEKRIGIFSSGIIWFGVAISVSEIEAGIEIGAAHNVVDHDRIVDQAQRVAVRSGAHRFTISIDLS